MTDLSFTHIVLKLFLISHLSSVSPEHSLFPASKIWQFATFFYSLRMNLEAHVSFALADTSGPSPIQTDFPSVLVCAGPITTVYLIWGGFDTLTLCTVYDSIRCSVSQWCSSMNTLVVYQNQFLNKFEAMKRPSSEYLLVVDLQRLI